MGASSVSWEHPMEFCTLWAQNMVPLQISSLSQVIIFSWPSQHGNECPKIPCPPTSTLTPSVSPCTYSLPVARGFTPHCNSSKSPILHMLPACAQRILNSMKAHYAPLTILICYPIWKLEGANTCPVTINHFWHSQILTFYSVGSISFSMKYK